MEIMNTVFDEAFMMFVDYEIRKNCVLVHQLMSFLHYC